MTTTTQSLPRNGSRGASFLGAANTVKSAVARDGVKTHGTTTEGMDEMAMVHTDDEILRLVIQWFSRQQSTTIPQSLKQPLQNYLARLPPAEQNSVVPHTPTRAEPQHKRRRTEANDSQCDVEDHQKTELSLFEREAREYLQKRHTARGESHSIKKWVRMWRMLNALNNDKVPKIPNNGFWNQFAAETYHSSSDRSRSQHSVASTTHEINSSQRATDWGNDNLHVSLRRLSKLHKNVQLSSQLHNLASRILAILIHYHHKQIKSIGIDRQAREAALLEITGISPEEFEKIRTRAQGWLRVVGVFGVGVLAVAGSEAEDEFEKHATLPFLGDCHAFFKDVYPDVLKKMSNTNGFVGSLFLQADESRTNAGCTLLNGSGKLTNALRKAFEEPERNTLSANSECDAQRYIDHPGASDNSSNDQVGSATSGITHHQTLDTLSSLQDVNEQPVGTRAPFSIPALAANGQRFEDEQNLHPHPQWRACAPSNRPQEATAQSADLGHSPNMANPTHAMLTEASEIISQQGSVNPETYHNPATGLQALVAAASAADQIQSSNDGFAVAFPSHHPAVMENVQAQHQHDQPEIQRFNDVVSTTANEIAVRAESYALSVDGQVVTTRKRHLDVYNNESSGQTTADCMMIRRPVIGEALEVPNDWSSHVQIQPSWQADAATAQAGHVEWEEWLLSLEPVDYSFEHQPH